MKSLPGEIWKHCPGSEENVEVSNMGRVRKNGKLVNKAINKDGYYEASFGRGVGRKLVHRIVALIYVPNDDPEHKTVVDHIGQTDKLDNRAENLRWVTPGENTRAAAKAGLITGKGKKGFIVLTEIATGIIKVFDSIVKAAYNIKGDERQLNQVIQGSRQRHRGHSAYRVEEKLTKDYYTLKIQSRGEKFKKEDYRKMVKDCLDRLDNLNPGRTES